MGALTAYLGIGLAVSLAATTAAGWLAWHEHGIAVAQASVDRARIAQVQATATTTALKLQQAIDAAQAAKLAALQAQSDQAIAWLGKYRTTTTTNAHAATRSVRTIIRHEPATACARTCIPPALGAQVPNWAVCHATP